LIICDDILRKIQSINCAGHFARSIDYTREVIVHRLCNDLSIVAQSVDRNNAQA